MNLTAESESLAEWLQGVREEDKKAIDSYKRNESTPLPEVELTENDLSYSCASGWNAGLEQSINIVNEYLRLNLIDPKMHDEVISKLEALKLSN